MPKENAAKTQESTKKARPYLPLTFGVVTFLGTLGFTGNWWRIATSNFRNMDTCRSTKIALDTAYTPEAIASRTEMIREHFVPMMTTTLRQTAREQMNDDEIKLAGSTLEKYEFLEQCNCSSGFFAAAWRNKETGALVLVLGGADINPDTPMAFFNDIDDIIMSASGGPISQLDDAVAFANSMKSKYGKISQVTGHSLGGYLSLYLMGLGVCGDATCTTFDSTGYTDAMISNCAARSGVSEEKIRKRFESPDIFTSVTVMHNGYNCMGRQAGAHLTFSNDINCRPFIPKKHYYMDFRKAFASGEQLIPGNPLGGSSYEAMIGTMALLTLSTGVLVGGALTTRRNLRLLNTAMQLSPGATHAEAYTASINPTENKTLQR